MPEPPRPEEAAVPSHPDRIEDPEPLSEGSRWAGTAVIVVIGAVLVLIVVLHLTGIVGPRAH